MVWPRAVVVAIQAVPPARPDASVGDGLAAVLVLGLPIVGAIVLITLYLNARREVRRGELQAPLFLLPYIAGTAPSGALERWEQRVDPDDLEVEHRRQMQLESARRRSQRLLYAVGANVLLLWVAGAWFVGRDRPDQRGPELAPVFAVQEEPVPSTPSGESPGESALDSDTAAAILVRPEPRLPPDRAERPRAETPSRSTVSSPAREPSPAVTERAFGAGVNVRESVPPAPRDSVPPPPRVVAPAPERVVSA
ncbi:MAG: hypothetical protein ACRENB_05790, partial [Gemmatimonadales bacterium]